MPGVQGGPPDPLESVMSKIYVPEASGGTTKVSVVLQIAAAIPTQCCALATIVFPPPPIL